MNRIVNRRRQRGAVIVTAALALLFLLGFMGIALDFGHLFVVKTELQTAMDSCALAAAQELDGQGTALTRATSAGMTAGNMNRVNMQSTTWSGKGQIVAANVTFRDAAYVPTTVPANARYAQCQHTQPNVNMVLLQAMGAFSGDTAGNPSTRNVQAQAVATRASTQTTCPIPVGLKPKPGGTAPNYGFQVGEWVTVYGDRVPNSGELGWYNLDGSTNANETRKELSEGGSCGTRIGDVLGTPGAQTTVDTPWNYRFGIYKNADYDPNVNHPDFSGYSYTANNWKNAVPQNAWSGTPAAGSHPTAANFLTKRAAFASFDDTGTSLTNGSTIVFGKANQLNSFKKLATPGNAGQHRQYGYSRRVVTVPVINPASKVIDYACMFMLHPLSGPKDDGHLEFLGNAGAATSPCTSNGLAGGSAGPLVPVLVR
ncbi:pilus assembly protein TadG-related protein [Variovorax fucosicus]|uniref:pilus assembly protein TadG-related protein n=1 Tax=Variovorax fucosicus TaxID=3053517 RepID=UPI0025758FDD|nr:pilus assembly protein TadG-related protein [Variovorax sp. J22G47]MDM0057532.1 pilus assembly protein TadG-related protein [Variovorax sp. J22G47]